MHNSLPQLFLETTRKFPDKKSFLTRRSGGFDGPTYSEFARRVASVAAALDARGIRRGDSVAIFSENRPEWAEIDLAALSLVAVVVPIYPSLTAEEALYILKDSGSKLVAVSTRGQLDKISRIASRAPDLKAIVAFDAGLEDAKSSPPVVSMAEFERQAPLDLTARAQGVQSEDVASIIYTSGTTGEPKGVVLTHGNFIHNLEASRVALSMGETDSHLSFLPLCHVFERMAGYYLMVRIGAQIAYAESMETVRENILEVKPTFLLGVPRFFEKVEARTIEKVNSVSALRRSLFFWAKRLGERKRSDKYASHDPLFRLKRAIAERLVYKKFQAGLGGRLRFCVSGGAPLSKEIAEFFHDLGVFIYEGYGLTETSPVISANREGRWKFGTVGIPLESVQVRIAEDGEIVTKSASVMTGYHNKPRETSEVLKDGWFHTGDLGRIDSDGFLHITGRKKELIVTSGGKKVSPRAIEEMVERDPLILRCVLYGEGRNFLTALVVPQKEEVERTAAVRGLDVRDYSKLLKTVEIQRAIEDAVQARCSDLANYERIKYAAILEHDFTQAAGELTPTLKVKRDVVFAKHADKLAKFYSAVPG